ncbi:MAG: hypothetical protein ABSG00_08310 [Terracidiphilus sp.]|jgi:hypothetical protein
MMGNEWVKRNKWIFVAGPLAFVAFIWVGGEVVMHLWNWLLPALFGWRIITFWQALGLMLLCRILFGRWHHGGNDHSRWQRPSDEKWKKMTPEEREKFRTDMRSRWHGCGRPSEETNEPT